MMRIIFSFCAFLFLTLSLPVCAQTTDTFNVNFQVISPDTIPPTTPTALTATPIASSQIDLSWGASTDDVALSGYQVFRDTVQIATTSLTTYSDTGLTASTTYSYYVIAFDTSYNYSSSSNSVSTTTLQSTPTTTPPTPESGGNGNAEVKLVSFDVESDIYAATIAWETNRYAQFELHWGRSASYELGFVSNQIFKREHSTTITDLEPGTIYEYQLLAYDRDGKRFVLKEGRFNTLDIPDATPPSNVQNLRAIAQKNDVLLTWENPEDTDFSYVRIVRSHLFYPTDPYDGFIAYQGTGESFLDKQAFSKEKYQYYTVFAYDNKGNISSGAVVAVTVGDLPEQESSSLPLSLTFEDIEVLQKNIRITNGELSADLQTTLRIPYEKLPEHLKTIVITLTHPNNQSSFSFLLRINKDKTYYEAILAPLRDSGTYLAVATIFDYETKQLLQLQGSFDVLSSGDDESFPPFSLSLSKDDLGKYIYLFWILLILLLLLLLYLYLRKTAPKNALGAVARVGGSFVFLLILTGLALNIGDPTSKQQLSALALTDLRSNLLPFIGIALAVIVLIIILIRIRKRGK